ncbi:MAG: peptidase and in kexin sedolisin [Frankiales bacterium]|nr:peptidase and in kexin sedolisin [Frankiales bacterium]
MLRALTRRRLLGVVLTGGLLLGTGAAHAELAPSAPPLSIVVDGGGQAAVDAVLAQGGTVTGRLPLIDGLTATVPSDRLSALRGALPTIYITPDVAVAAAVPEAPATDDVATTSLKDVVALTGAASAQAAGLTGKGVDVALLDSGVSPTALLDVPGKVVHGPDLSLESQDSNVRYLDTYGHGTHLGAIIAGKEGLAPGSRLVSVKVGSSTGSVDVSQLIAGIDWVVQNKNSGGLNIRVLNLSVGSDSLQRAALDPLVHAADVAWRKGILVVAAVGNDGKDDHRVASPSSDPNVLAVGGTDSHGSLDPSQSTLADFTSRGNGKRRADLLAPGARIASARVAGGYLDTQFPAARRGDTLFRGSGTSQSAAVVSGAAALLLEQRPGLTPDQLKALLTTTSASVRGNTLRQLDVAAALGAPTPSKVQTLKQMTGRGTLEGTRGDSHVVQNGVELDGERDIFGRPFDSAAWSDAASKGATWSNGTWNGATWSGATWSGATWSGATWSGATWSGATWSGATWSGATWSGATWSGATWSGATWSGATWSGATWSGATWSGATWSGATWSGATWSGATWSGATWSGVEWLGNTWA